MAIGVTSGAARILTDPVMGYNFVISLIEASTSPAGILTSIATGIQNVVLGGFSECSGLEVKLSVEPLREGGNNQAVLQFPTRAEWTNIRLRRGVTLSDDLWNWHYDFVKGTGKRRHGIIALMNNLHIPIKAWYFQRGIPVRWTGPAFNAMEGRVAVEELEIAHEGVRLFSAGSALSTFTGVSF